jgi:alpha-amylase/alpha-mannosidase (GH57 family)
MSWQGEVRAVNMTDIAILWHMHQPFYEDLAAGEHILPWVRLHALKDYYGMVALLREFPSVKVTFNLVPSLLVQLEAFAGSRARERYLDLSLKPAADLDEADIDFIVGSFFDAQHQHLIDPNPRYAELLALRGAWAGSPADRRAALGRFTRDDLRDLQVWQKLAWIDPLYWDRDPRVRELVTKGRGYTEDDKHLLREVEIEILNKVIPEYRDAADRGQIEISASPFYHPILPLLCDSQVYLRTHPDSRPPRFTHPEDAAEQLARAVRCHERLFGRRPTGLWPSEGSVSDAMVPLVTASGFRWMATDELILARTLNISFSRDGRGQVDQPERLYVPYTLRVGDRSVQCAFRDHALSDLIGFTYSSWAAEAAADDFVSRLVEAGRRFRARSGGGEAFIPIILDGENAWEYFEGGGRPFLRALYSRLSNHSELRTVTMTEGTARSGPALSGIFPGSWIDANFYIWIGHADDQKAWSQLADARRALEQATAIDATARATAEEEVFIAEGSDWFWWYGDDHSSDHDLEFDDLFRRHLRNMYRLLKKEVPEELFVSNISTGGSAPAQTPPTALLSPTIDGEETSYFEWLRAGSFETRERAGAMHQAERRPDVLTLVRFGFDRERLFVRVDAVEPVSDLLQSGHEISLKFLAPAGLRYSVRKEPGAGQSADGGPILGEVWKWQDGERRWVNLGPLGSQVAAGTILEVALPLADLEVKAGGAIELVVALAEGSDRETERHPAQHPIELTVPDELFEARHWQA